jgi:hypothetical protein
MSDLPLDPDTDPFKPPTIPTVVSCLHCGEDFDSYLIEWRVETGEDGSAMGFWCCPTPGCSGKGFGFDIFPLDPEYRDENGDRLWNGDEDEGDDEPFENDNGDQNNIPF